MSISKKVDAIIKKSSWIRKMFEEGMKLKSIYGEDNVFDFSLGNPSIDPPEKFKKVITDIVSDMSGPHGYMPNTGYPSVRKAVADYISKEQNIDADANDIIMTCGAAGGLNIIFKAILDSGDEVVTPAPYFVEYNFYTDNHGGVLKTAATNEDFTLNTDAIASAITDKTKAVLINSPHNPTGQVYSEASLKELGNLLKEKSAQYGKIIYLISDEPYRKLVFNNIKVPSIFDFYKNSIMTTSYSKDLSLAGERLGFTVISPKAELKEEVLSGMALANRILGYVNAPSLIQLVAARLQGESADISEYERKKVIFCEGLKKAGYEFIEPAGTFYIFPKSPIKDDAEFVSELQKEKILVVPGSGFGGPGYFRIAFCVSDKTIINALPGFERAMKKYR
ncbi:MAG: pyridoxal phosphate-dependent aminotransferase [Deltaproteobacteria bacterium]|nr:pyridoxal phosphate-dependent aminotransferase [Deltaproteobacteria bacterium]